jgi:hypothetical protein
MVWNFGGGPRRLIEKRKATLSLEREAARVPGSGILRLAESGENKKIRRGGRGLLVMRTRMIVIVGKATSNCVNIRRGGRGFLVKSGSMMIKAHGKASSNWRRFCQVR